jgi:hypothetical protein
VIAFKRLTKLALETAIQISALDLDAIEPAVEARRRGPAARGRAP